VPSPRIHHINFVVRDLAKAATMFEHLLGLSPFEFVDHSSRGAKVARSPIGDAWFVLVCPYDPDSVPGRFLAEHGEGFFLLSVGTNDLDEHLHQLQSAGLNPIDSKPRNGILDWHVADIAEVHGVLLQLAEQKNQD
jgi:methylmalonyl-CoA/ethylmalonyl-CoA epimerase